MSGFGHFNRTIVSVLWIYLILFSTGASSQRQEDIGCVSPWVQTHRSCVRFVKDVHLTWHDARKECKSQGADLMSINDSEELKELNKKLKKEIIDVSLLNWWVGLRWVTGFNKTDGSRTNITNWLWVDNEEFNPALTGWAPRFGTVGTPSKECVQLNYQSWLKNLLCDEVKPYICEEVRVTLPPTSSSLAPTHPTETTTTLKPDTNTTNHTTGRSTTTEIQEKTKDPNTKKPTDATSAPRTTIGNDETSSQKNKPSDKEFEGCYAVNYESSCPPVEAFNISWPRTEPGKMATVECEKGQAKWKCDKNPTCWKGDPDVKHCTYTSTEATSAPPTTTAHDEISSQTNKPSKDEFKGCYAVNYESSCPPVEALGISWPSTEPGQNAIVQCDKGHAKWKCDKNPTCWKGEPDVKQCTSEKIQELTKKIEDLLKGDNVTSEQAVEFTETLASAVAAETVMSEQDIFQSTKLMNKAAKTKPNNASAAKDIIENVLKCGNSLVSKKRQATWSGMNTANKRAVASSLIDSMESVSKEMMKAFTEPTVEKIEEENMAIELHVINVTDMTFEKDVVYEGEANTFSIPIASLQEEFNSGGLARLVFINYNNVAELLQPDVDKDGTSERRIITQVLSASFVERGKEQILPDSEMVSYTFKTENRDGNDAPWKQICSFWNFSLGYTGAWSQKGCSLKRSNSTHTTCECNHLTNFAILMDVHKTPLSEVHATVLSFITYVGIIISIICLFISWLTFTCLSTVQGERNSIHKHLVFCLFIAEVLFLAGIERTDHEIACAIIAGCLHFFFLGSFTWMFLEGVHILFMLVQVFDSAKSRMKQYYLIGYGCPLITVGISALVYHDGYGTKQYCWLSTERMFLWSFAGPVAFILLVNLMILIYAMSAVCKHSEYVFSKEKSTGGNIKAWIQGALALEVLLGLTWVFGYFYISEEAIPMAYLFTIFNSLQGLFIFVFHCILNKKVRKEYENFIAFKPRMSTGTHTTSKSANGSAASGPHSGTFALTGSRKQSNSTGFIDLSKERQGSTTSA